MAKWHEKLGTVRSTDGGSFRLKVKYTMTDNAITFTPSVVIKTATESDHKGTVSWRNVKGTTVKHSKTIKKAKGTTSFGTYTNKDQSIKIKLSLNGKTSSVTLERTTNPNKPSLKVTYKGDSHFAIEVAFEGENTRPISSAVLQRCEDVGGAGQSWDDVYSWSGLGLTGKKTYTLDDTNTERGHRYLWRIRCSGATGTSAWAKTSDWRFTLPSDVSDVAHERTSRFVNTVSWSANNADITRGVIKSFDVLCSVNGGAYELIANVPADESAQQGVHEYVHVTTDDNSYAYKVFPRNTRGALSTGAATDTTYNTPAMPEKIEGSYTADGDVKLTLINNPHTATALYIDRTADGGTTWTNIAEVDETDEPCTEYLDESVPSGTLKYRARNFRDDDGLPAGERYSNWNESNEISTLSVPNPPTLIKPFTNASAILSNNTVRLMWIHNPTDGSDQSAFKLSYAVNDGAPTEVTGTTDLHYDLDLTAFSPNDIITWKVKTKGAHANYSEWSDERTFTVLTRPEIAFTSPSGGSTIENLPLNLEWNYTDTSGTLEELTVDIVHNENVEKTISVDIGDGTSGTYTYSLADFLFENEEAYTLSCSARSTSGLVATDEISIIIGYVPVVIEDGLFASADVDEETGYIAIQIESSSGEGESDSPDPDDDDPEDIEVESDIATAHLYRVVNGERTSLGTVADGDYIEDKYAPLNRDFEYELLMLTEDGHVSYTTVTVNLGSDYWFCYWGDENIARARWNPNGSVSVSRPEKAQIRYSGRTYPVTYDSKAIEETYSFSGVITERAELDSFIRLMREGGQGVWKSADGEVYAADFDFSYSADYTRRNMWNCTLDVTRIESEEL